MELELKKEQFACYQALPQLSENREETTETLPASWMRAGAFSCAAVRSQTEKRRCRAWSA